MKSLKGKTVLLTGGSNGIGVETAKAFAELEATVIIVDIDVNGLNVVNYVNDTYPNKAFFYQVDLSIESDVLKLCEQIVLNHECPHIIFNNATIAPLGNIGDVNMLTWDKSYAINLKAPLLFTNFFIPHMMKRNEGCFVFVSSSGAAPFMGAYETFKTAQVELSNTLAMELEKTDVFAYTIGPGLVKTKTAENSIIRVASQMGLTLDEFYNMNKDHILDEKDAGLGFALSVLNAKRYHGQEISSIQVLNDFDYYKSTNKNDNDLHEIDIELLSNIINTFQDQYKGWKEMNIFERQWVFRDFKKYMGVSADKVHNVFLEIKQKLSSKNELENSYKSTFEKLKVYWEHQLDLLQGFEKDPAKLKENSFEIKKWIADLELFINELDKYN